MNALTPLDLIQALRDLIQETPTILASPEDALYFRTQNKSSPAQVATPKPKSFDPPLTLGQLPSPPAKIKEKIEPLLPEPIKTEPPTKEIKTQSPEQSVSLEPTVKPSAKPFPTGSLLFTLFQKIAPHISTFTEIPNDAIAKKIATRWKTRNQTAPISILSFHEQPKQKALLLEITKAIDIYFGPARLIEADPIEKEKQWDTFLTDPNLKVIIACDYTLWQLENLMRSYKENSFEQTRMLGNIPLLLLPDLSLYLKDPLLKRSLWKGLCQKLSS